MNRTSIYVYSTIRSAVREVCGLGAYMLAWTKGDGTPGTKTRPFELNANASMAEVQLVAAALKELAGYNMLYEAEIFMHQQAAYMALSSYMPKWYADGWLNSKGEEVSDWYKLAAAYGFRRGNTLSYTTKKGEFSSWLEANIERAEGEKRTARLLTMEELTEKERRA